MDKSLKKIQAEVRPPPSRQCLYFGKFWTGIPSLRMNNNGQTLEQMLYVHVAMIMMRSIRRTTPPPMATCFFLFSHHICLCSFDSTFWNCFFLCVGVIRKYVQALSDITVFMLQKRNCVLPAGRSSTSIMTPWKRRKIHHHLFDPCLHLLHLTSALPSTRVAGESANWEGRERGQKKLFTKHVQTVM